MKYLSLIFMLLSINLSAQITLPNSVLTLDTTFNNYFPNTISKIYQLPDGRILLKEDTILFSSVFYGGVFLVDSNGIKDQTLDLGNSDIESSYLLYNGKIIVSIDNPTNVNEISKYDSNGLQDSSFYFKSNAPYSLFVPNFGTEQSDGKIILLGNFGGAFPYRNYMRIDSLGKLDTTFIDYSYFNIFQPRIVKELPNGKILIGGGDKVVLLENNGIMDSSFIVSINGDVRCIELQNDGKIIIGGKFDTINGSAINNIARLNIDGSIDTTFQIGTGPFVPNFDISGVNLNCYNYGGAFSINDIKVQNDGKVLCGGNVKSFDGYPILNLFRLKPNGRIDTTFKVSFDENHRLLNGFCPTSVKSICMLNDGSILVGGSFDSINNIPAKNLAHLYVSNTTLSTESLKLESAYPTKVIPNPFNNSAVIKMEGYKENQKYYLNIYSLSGHSVKTTDSFQEGEFIITKEGLCQGIYFYAIIHDGIIISRGKFVVE